MAKAGKAAKRATRRARRKQRRKERGGSFFGRALRSAVGMVPGVGGFLQEELQAKANKRLGIDGGLAMGELEMEVPTQSNSILARIAERTGQALAANEMPVNFGAPDVELGTEQAQRILAQMAAKQAANGGDDPDGDPDGDGKSWFERNWQWVAGGVGLVALIAILVALFRSKK